MAASDASGASGGCSAPESDALSETEPDVLAAVADIDVDRDENPGACTPGLVWTSTSRRIEVRSYSFWQGSSGYRVERTALTAAQRTALNALCVRPQPTGPVFADISAFQIDVTDNNGSVKSYRSAIDDLLDGLTVGRQGSLARADQDIAPLAQIHSRFRGAMPPRTLAPPSSE